MDDEQRQRRELRSWSIEPRDRRVHAVSPMHLQEGRILNSLLHEAHNIPSKNGKIIGPVHENDFENFEDVKLQKMLNKYQSQVLQQQMSSNRINNHEIKKSFPCSSGSGQQYMTPMSHSQPCLITISDQKNDPTLESNTSVYRFAQRFEVDENASLKLQLLSSQNLVRTLQEEITTVKQQCEFFKMKASRLKQLESAYETIEKEYENLTAQKELQDNLEKTARTKLEQHLARYASENELLRANIEQLIKRLQTDDQSEKINKLSLMLNELIPQNKELLACKSRQKMDIEALEATLKDQRNHIQILERALSNAQEKAWRKEKEVEELKESVDRADSMQKTRSFFDKKIREDEWGRERAQLEMENAQLKMQLTKDNMTVGMKKGNNARSPDSEGDKLVAKLRKTLYTKENRVIQLEKLVMELEAKFHEEVQRNRMAIATQSDTLSGKLKKMEEEKTEKDRKIAELTEQKERLSEKLEAERKHSESRTNLLEREIDRIRISDDRRLREDMARMEQMRLKLVDRRCFTAERTRSRCATHARTSSTSSHPDFMQSHLRANSVCALSPSKSHFCSNSMEVPLDLSKSSNKLLQNDQLPAVTPNRVSSFGNERTSLGSSNSEMVKMVCNALVEHDFDDPSHHTEAIIENDPMSISNHAIENAIPAGCASSTPGERKKSGEQVWDV